ncbi:TlpA family protein disulfide reductase [Catenulispora rubra]|uniref:TlpA family protein disulfide reductase n=1 Tax=Catenulispora rubra TaxID=280293 RepID=UPI00189227B7|nr:TlpA disulfide reductase family protein [Catenulispora rubra]
MVVNIWGSWCGPCREEAPVLSQISAAPAAQGVRFWGIDTHDTDQAALAFEHEYGIAYPSLADPNGSLTAALAAYVPVDAVPSTLVVDATGHIADRFIGRVDAATLTRMIDVARSETARKSSALSAVHHARG